MKFHRNWTAEMDETGRLLGYVPKIAVELIYNHRSRVTQSFLVDSGSEFSIASRAVGESLGIPWEDGDSMALNGVNDREECRLIGRIHEVDLVIDEIEEVITIPFFFAIGDAPNLLGRLGFFDAFRIEFDQSYRTTTFEYLLGAAE